MAEIAWTHGFLLGGQLPNTVYGKLYFADQNWKKPQKEFYFRDLQIHRPYVATVLDLEREDQLDEVLVWAETISPWVKTIIVIPKVTGMASSIPHRVGRAEIRLGYSVSTRYGGTELPLWEFSDRPIHLLGGSPAHQMQIAHYLNVVSVDGNGFQKEALRRCQVWFPGKKAGRNGYVSLEKLDGRKTRVDAPYEAFRRSCVNIIHEWSQIAPINTEAHTQEYLCPATANTNTRN